MSQEYGQEEEAQTDTTARGSGEEMGKQEARPSRRDGILLESHA